MQDDILDVTGDTATLGKTQGKDSALNKPTFPSIIGLEASREKALELHEKALQRFRYLVRKPTFYGIFRRGSSSANTEQTLVLDNTSLNNLSETYPILAQIDSPADLRELDEDQLPALADELRAYLLQSLSQTGGHLASGLGSVEITIALHYLFDTPHDRLVWDVGHQCYPHKILTGRRDRCSSMRQQGGLSGFPKITESEYDHFGAGHSSTSISAALGMAIAAAKRKGRSARPSPIIGDGGMTAGMAYEALNHGGAIDNDLLVILNDNEMSISPNVGAMSKYLSSIWSGKIYSSLRSGSKKVLQAHSQRLGTGRRAEEHVKGMVTPGHAVRGARLFLLRPDRRPQPERPVVAAAQPAATVGTAHAAHRYPQGQGLPAGRGGCLQVSRCRALRPGNRRSQIDRAKPGVQILYQYFFRLAGRQRATGRNLHAITPAMREGSGLVKFSELNAGALPRRRHRRAARGDPGRGHGARGPETGGRDLLHLPATRLRPVRARRRGAGIST